MISRKEEVDRWVCQRFLTAPDDQRAFHHDVIHHASVTQMRQLLAATDDAMNAEGVSVEVRDRVIYRLLFGDDPGRYEAPDWRDAADRLVQRANAAMRLAEQPVSVVLSANFA